MCLAFLIASAMAHSRAGHGLAPISLSFRAARIVAAKRIAYFRCSSMSSPRGNGETGYASTQTQASAQPHSVDFRRIGCAKPFEGPVIDPASKSEARFPDGEANVVAH